MLVCRQQRQHAKWDAQRWQNFWFACTIQHNISLLHTRMYLIVHARNPKFRPTPWLHGRPHYFARVRLGLAFQTTENGLCDDLCDAVSLSGLARNLHCRNLHFSTSPPAQDAKRASKPTFTQGIPDCFCSLKTSPHRNFRCTGADRYLVILFKLEK